jgi:hypothetical protein
MNKRPVLLAVSMVLAAIVEVSTPLLADSARPVPAPCFNVNRPCASSGTGTQSRPPLPKMPPAPAPGPRTR